MKGQLINMKEMLALKAASVTFEDFMYHFTNFALSKTRNQTIDSPEFRELIRRTEQSPAVKRLMEIAK